MHEHFLMVALAKAKERLGFCSPNPAVGACIVHRGELVISAHHYACGKAHAEQNALLEFQKMGYQADETTVLYVTLEPCNHWGKTPPCTSMIVDSGIKKVVYAYKDPNPVVSQANTEKLLKASGVDCQIIEVEAIDDFYKPYLYWMKNKRPYVTSKMAQSLDGKIGASKNKPFALSKEPLNTLTHQMRLESDGILTTAKTVLSDNCRLNVRLADKIIAKPVFILDRNLRLSGNEAVFQSASKVVIFHDAAKKPGFSHQKTDFVASKVIDNGFVIADILDYLGQELGVHHLFVEAGGLLFSELLAKNLINQAHIYMTPYLLGANAPSLYQGDSPCYLPDSAFVSMKPYGNQWLYTFDFTREG